MTTTRGSFVAPRETLSRPDRLQSVLARLSELEALVASTVARLAQLERGRGPRDEADRVLIRCIFFESIGSMPFRTSDAIRFSRLERGSALRAALVAADVDNEKQLGQLLARYSRLDSIDGLRVERARRRRHWRVVVAVVNDTPDSGGRLRP